MSTVFIDQPGAALDAGLFFDGAGVLAGGKAFVKVKLGMHRLPLLARLQRAQDILTAMTGNPHFPAPNPTLVFVQGKLTAAQTAFNDYDAALAACAMHLAARQFAMRELMATLGNLATHVDNIANGNEMIIHSAAMEVRTTPGPVGPLATPVGLLAADTDTEGQLALTWDPVYGADNYTVQMHADPLNGNGGWVQVGLPSRASLIVNGLISGQKYWFRVAGNGTAGQSAFSDPACRIPQ